MSAIDLRCGDWRDVLADVGEVDTLISDPPYSERTHAGHNSSAASVSADDERKYGGRHARKHRAGIDRRSIHYQPMSESDVALFVEHWSRRVRGWFVVMTDHVLMPAWEAHLNCAGRYVFPPLQFIAPGSRVRLGGDGPSLWSVTMLVARPKTPAFLRWGSLPGGYVLPPREKDRDAIIGGKPLWIMRALVRDYSRPGDLICDPCAGGATTLIAAAIEGRRAIGAELDPSTHANALKRIAMGYTPTLFDTSLQPTAAAVQSGLFDDDAK